MRIRLTHLVSTAVVALVASLVLTPAAPAKGGGPTSVLLSVPGAQSMASLYYTQTAYDELSELVGVGQPGGTFPGDDGGPPSDIAPGINVTWLIHDVSPWRVDRIVLANDGAWISTNLVDSRGRFGRLEPVWHRPADPAGLVGLLKRLGLDLKAAAAPGFQGVAGEPAPVPVEESVAPVTAGDDDTSPTEAVAPPVRTAATSSTWPWAVGGLVAGLGLSLLLALAWTRRPRRQPVTTEEPLGSDPHAEVLVRS